MKYSLKLLDYAEKDPMFIFSLESTQIKSFLKVEFCGNNFSPNPFQVIKLVSQAAIQWSIPFPSVHQLVSKSFNQSVSHLDYHFTIQPPVSLTGWVSHSLNESPSQSVNF